MFPSGTMFVYCSHEDTLVSSITALCKEHVLNMFTRDVSCVNLRQMFSFAFASSIGNVCGLIQVYTGIIAGLYGFYFYIYYYYLYFLYILKTPIQQSV